MDFAGEADGKQTALLGPACSIRQHLMVKKRTANGVNALILSATRAAVCQEHIVCVGERGVTVREAVSDTSG